MRWSTRVATAGAVAGATAVAVRLAHARHERPLHPDGRCFHATLDVWGVPDAGTGAALLDTLARHPTTVRLSKGAGTPPGWADVLGLAVRVHHPAPHRPQDLLLSTTGHGRWGRHVPVPRRSFDTVYGSILSYRAGPPDAQRTVYLAAVPDPGGVPLGRTLASVAAVAAVRAASLLLTVLDADGFCRPFGRLSFGPAVSPAEEADLAFDPVRNTSPDLHPTGLVHASRAWAYRAAQRWRGVRPAPDDPLAAARTATHR